MAHATTKSVPAIIVGGGPTGIMAGVLLARAGVPVTVLEKHADFLRDFRGDTVHPSTLELFQQLGCLQELLQLPHSRVDEIRLRIAGRHFRLASFRSLPVAVPFIAMMPQWDLLDFLARKGRELPGFDLRMSCEAVGVTHDESGRVAGVDLAIGDAAHAMSPIGGVGINVAVQDAVAAANILVGPRLRGENPDPLLGAVQASRRRGATRMQRFQQLAQSRVIAPVLNRTSPITKPFWPVRLFDRFPALRRIPGRVIGLGFDRVEITAPQILHLDRRNNPA